jgi:hypothetical protein
MTSTLPSGTISDAAPLKRGPIVFRFSTVQGFTFKTLDTNTTTSSLGLIFIKSRSTT